MKKDYSDKQIASRPSILVEELKLKKQRQLFRRLIGALAIVLFFAVNYIFWFLPMFRVKTIQINGEYDHTLTESLLPILEKKYIGKHILLTRSNQSSDDISIIVPNLVSVSLSRHLPSSLTVHILQRQPIYRITQLDSPSFLADRDGFVFALGTSTQWGIITVELPTSTTVSLHSTFLSSNEINNLSSHISLMSSKLNIKVTKISQINNLPSHVRLYSQKKWYLMIDLYNDATETIQTLKTFLSEKYQMEPTLTYIDLRIPKSVYYK